MQKAGQTLKKRKRRNKTDYGDDFVAPDGGWGWIVAIAAGISYVSVIGFVQTFGLLFRDRMQQIGLANSQITAIGNTNVALSSCVGLFNGPLFRRLSCRQVGIMGSILSTVGIFLTSFASSFISFFIPYAILFGFGMGFVISAATLALNTYFKVKRSTAASLSWTIAGLGPVFLPIIIGLSLPRYGYMGTIWLFSMLTLHNLPSALIFQPVLWHAKKLPELVVQDEDFPTSLFDKSECQIKELHDNNNNNNKNTDAENESTSSVLIEKITENSRIKLSSIKRLNYETLDKQSVTSFFISTENIFIMNIPKHNLSVSADPLRIKENPSPNNADKWTTKVSKYFGLDLFKDFTYVNLMVGLTMTSFSEVNISLLTPFFLSDFGFSINEITLILSSLGITDLIVRLSTSFIAPKLNWSGPSFYICGVMIMVATRFVIAMSPSFNVMLLMYIVMGIGKAWRTIFTSLVIASHIELKQLPAASGLQLMSQGLFALACGPFVGLIKDATNYTITIIILNMISSLPMLAWLVEIWYLKYKH